MSRKDYQSVEIEHTDLLPRIKNLTQKDWIKAATKLGIWIAPGGGKGSHVAGYVSVDCKRTIDNLVITLQKNNLHPAIQKDYLKKLIAFGLEDDKYSEDKVWKALKLLK